MIVEKKVVVVVVVIVVVGPSSPSTQDPFSPPYLEFPLRTRNTNSITNTVNPCMFSDT